MNLKRTLFALISFFALAPFAAHAQETPPAPALKAVITSDTAVAVSTPITFSGSDSDALNATDPIRYSWTFSDGAKAEGELVTHEFEKPGMSDAILVMRQSGQESQIQKHIFVYTRALNIFSTEASGTDQLESVKTFAAERFIYLNIVEDYKSASEFDAIANLTQSITRSASDLERSSTIILWTKGGLGLNALADFAKVKDVNLDMSTKTIVYVTDGNLSALSRIAGSIFQVLHPKEIILTRPEALFTVVEGETGDKILSQIVSRVYEYRLVNEATAQVSVLNFLSVMVNYLRNKGLSSDALLLLLMIPVIATIVTFARQVIGINTIGIYVPTILTLVFVTLGVSVGMFLLCIVLGLVLLTRKLLPKLHLLFIPRLAITVTFVSIGFLFTFFIGGYYGLNLAKTSMVPIIVLILLSEDFVSVASERGVRASLLLVVETTAVSLVCYLMVAKWEAFQTMILGYPEIILGLLVIDVLLGRFTGLRLTELLRFRTLLTHAEQAEE